MIVEILKAAAMRGYCEGVGAWRGFMASNELQRARREDWDYHSGWRNSNLSEGQ